MQEEALVNMKEGAFDEQPVETLQVQAPQIETAPVVQENGELSGELVEREAEEVQAETLAEIHRLEAELQEKILQQQKEEALTKELENLLKLEETAIKELNLKQQLLEKEYLQ